MKFALLFVIGVLLQPSVYARGQGRPGKPHFLAQGLPGGRVPPVGGPELPGRFEPFQPAEQIPDSDEVLPPQIDEPMPDVEADLGPLDDGSFGGGPLDDGAFGLGSLIEFGLKRGIRRVLHFYASHPTARGLLDELRDLPVTDTVNRLLCLAGGYEHYHDGSCYTLKTEEKDFDDAQADCESDGGHLAIINSDCEFQYMTEIVTDWTWIGLNDKDEENTFVWVDGTSHIPEDHRHWWLEDKPDTDRNNRDCVRIKIEEDATAFDDHRCRRTNHYICEKEL